jgi:G2/mitotic-specific cyclin 1/2
MRGILMDWLIQVHSQFRLLPETLFLAVNIIDRFLTARVVSLAKLQLVGITAMFIASKYEEIMAPTVDNFLRCAERSYDEKAILEAEKYLLRTIDWNLSYPNPIHFLRRASKADGYNIQTRTVAKYFIEISCVEWRLLGTVPSLIAAAAIWLARLVLDRDEWTPNLQHYASYTEEAIIPTANIMLNFVLRPIRHECFFNKYASKKYMKASTYVRDWAISKWGEDAGGSVRLEDYLDELKMASKKRRELAEMEEQLEDGGRDDF